MKIRPIKQTKRSILLLSLGISIFIVHCTNRQYSAYRTVHHSVEQSTSYQKLNHYQKDLLVLANIIKDYYPNRREMLPDSVLNKVIQEGIAVLAVTDRDQAVMEYQRLISLLKNNHSYVYHPNMFREGDNIFLFTQAFIEGKWRITAIHADYPSSLTGAQLLAINGAPIDSVFQAVKPFINEESEQNMYYSVYQSMLFGRQQFMYNLGFGNTFSPDLMTLTIRDSSGTEQDVDIHAVSKSNGIKWHAHRFLVNKTFISTDSGYIYRFFPEKSLAYLQINTFLDKQGWKQGIRNEVPWYYRPFAFSMLNKAYRGKPNGRFKGVRPGTEHIESFYEEFFSKLSKSSCNNLVIDIRNNTGGDIFHTYQLLSLISNSTELQNFERHIKYRDLDNYLDGNTSTTDFTGINYKVIGYDTFVKLSDNSKGEGIIAMVDDPSNRYYLNRKGKIFDGNVFVLTSPSSVSAATGFAVLVQDNGLGSVMGQSPANRTAKQTGFTRFKLPNTSIVISLSTLYLVRPDQENPNEHLIPDYPIPLTLSSEDETFNALLRLIEGAK